MQFQVKFKPRSSRWLGQAPKGPALGFRANESALHIEVYRSEPSEGTDPDPALLPETRRAALSAAQKHLNFLD
jgi:hypothetical protein